MKLRNNHCTAVAGQRALGALAACMLIALLALCGCSSAKEEKEEAQTLPDVTGIDGMDFTYSDRDMDGTWDDASAKHVTLTGQTGTTTDSGVAVEGGKITIAAEGTYVFEGSLTGQVVVDAGKDAKVQVVLKGVEISNATGPALYVKQADKVFVTLAEGTDNVLTDSGSASYTFDEDDEPDAVLFSKDDLAINGAGSLSVDASFSHGIKSKDDLIVTGGAITVSAAADALRGKDCVKISGGTFVIAAGSDGIQSSNSSDDTRGFVSIDGGSFAITAGDDGIQAYTYARIMDGELLVTSTDDAVHSDGAAYVAGGALTIAAGDDALHSETVLTVDGGAINITACYEGLESEKVYVNGGDITVVASDDGLNAASAEISTDSEESEAQANGGRPDGGMAEHGGMGMGDENCLIQINGGTIYLDTQGDSIDSNGNVEITGGTLLVSGPSADMDAAFDYDLSATITGGTVLMVGSSGMAQNFTSGTQAFALGYVSGQAGSQVTLCDASGAEVASLTATKSFKSVLVSYPGCAEGDVATVKVNGTATSLTMSTTASSGYGGMGQGGNPYGAGRGGDVQSPDRGGQPQGGGNGMGQSQPTGPGATQGRRM